MYIHFLLEYRQKRGKQKKRRNKAVNYTRAYVAYYTFQQSEKLMTARTDTGTIYENKRKTDLFYFVGLHGGNKNFNVSYTVLLQKVPNCLQLLKTSILK